MRFPLNQGIQGKKGKQNNFQKRELFTCLCLYELDICTCQVRCTGLWWTLQPGIIECLKFKTTHTQKCRKSPYKEMIVFFFFCFIPCESLFDQGDYQSFRALLACNWWSIYLVVSLVKLLKFKPNSVCFKVNKC